MVLTGKHMSRRTALRGLGATIALPLLDSMVPARAAFAQSAAGKAASRTRLVCIEQVHGAAGCSEYGASQFFWNPEKTGRTFDLSKGSLSSLEPFRKHLTIVSNTDTRMAEAFQPAEVGGDHFRSSAVMFTHARPKLTEGSDVHVGTSMDQLYVQKFGQDTPIPSMQLSIEPVDQSGGCAYGYACVYTDTISWAKPDEPLPMVRDPRAAFDQLFGVGATPAERAANRRTDRSILDWVTGEVSRIAKGLGPADRRRLDQYLTEIREIERRIQRVESYNASGEPRDLPGAPMGVPDSFSEHVKLMYDLQAIAFAADITRVFSFKLGRDGSARVYPESGAPLPFHPASHHGENEQRVAQFAQINKYHVGLVPYFLDKLKSIQEGDANLLDKTLVIYGSPMGNSNTHNHKRCPLFLAGHANGMLKGNLHVKAADGTPMANAMLTLLHGLGLDDMKSFGDSTAPMDLNAVPTTVV
jgi:uncharacterized protein DUF1552